MDLRVSDRLWCVRYVGEQPLFEHAGYPTMRLEMVRVDHRLVGLAAFGRKSREDLVEYAKPAPPDEAVIDRLGRSIVSGHNAPPQAIPDHEDNTTDDPTIIDPWHAVRQREIRLDDPWHAVRQREIRLDPALLRLRQSEQITHGDVSHATIEPTYPHPRNQFNKVPEPRVAVMGRA